MENIKSYIIEKLKLNKNTKPDKTTKKISYTNFLKALKNCGEIELGLIFGEGTLPTDHKDREILSIWVVNDHTSWVVNDHTLGGDTIYYSYYSKEAGYDCEGILNYDWFTEDEKQWIYNYIMEF